MLTKSQNYKIKAVKLRAQAEDVTFMRKTKAMLTKLLDQKSCRVIRHWSQHGKRFHAAA